MVARSGVGVGKRLPVFVFPEELRFVFPDERTHKQVVTLYNPYDFSLNFKVLCNAPQKYNVVESQGVLKAQCCVDIVVRHTAVKDSKLGSKDKFRIDFFQEKKLVGKKYISAIVVKDCSHPYEQDSGEFAELPTVPVPKPVHHHWNVSKETIKPSPAWLMAVVAAISLLFLLLPLEGESSSWPGWLHVTVNMKLIAAFALGMVTMAILRS